eukprot:scaffold492186_cov22-Prasinocladus_malaysianus.AAC.1
MECSGRDGALKCISVLWRHTSTCLWTEWCPNYTLLAALIRSTLACTKMGLRYTGHGWPAKYLSLTVAPSRIISCLGP